MIDETQGRAVPTQTCEGAVIDAVTGIIDDPIALDVPLPSALIARLSDPDA
jgi:hypothetical protein